MLRRGPHTKATEAEPLKKDPNLVAIQCCIEGPVMHDICLDHLQRRRVAIVAAARVSTNGEFVSFEAPD